LCYRVPRPLYQYEYGLRSDLFLVKHATLACLASHPGSWALWEDRETSSVEIGAN